MSETRHTPLAPRKLFLRRLAQNAGIALLAVGGSLVLGMWGYRYFEGMRWIDAFLNAAMLLGGMGPVDLLTNDGVKLFAGAYALYCGVVFIATAGLVLAPVGSHILHRFHLDKD